MCQNDGCVLLDETGISFLARPSRIMRRRLLDQQGATSSSETSWWTRQQLSADEKARAAFGVHGRKLPPRGLLWYDMRFEVGRCATWWRSTESTKSGRDNTDPYSLRVHMGSAVRSVHGEEPTEIIFQKRVPGPRQSWNINESHAGTGPSKHTS